MNYQRLKEAISKMISDGLQDDEIKSVIKMVVEWECDDKLKSIVDEVRCNFIGHNAHN